MLWYVIRYKDNTGVVEKTFTQMDSAERYKEILDERNTSMSWYSVECSPLGPKYLQMIIDYRLNQYKTNQKKVTNLFLLATEAA